MPWVPLNINSARHEFAMCRTEAKLNKVYENMLKSFASSFTEQEKKYLNAMYERRLYDIKHPTIRRASGRRILEEN